MCVCIHARMHTYILRTNTYIHTHYIHTHTHQHTVDAVKFCHPVYALAPTSMVAMPKAYKREREREREREFCVCVRKIGFAQSLYICMCMTVYACMHVHAPARTRQVAMPQIFSRVHVCVCS